MPKFGPSALKDYLHLFSSDLVLDIDNQNIGTDLLRRICGDFFYYSTEDGIKCVESTDIDGTNVDNLIGNTTYKMEPDHCDQIQYVEANPARIQLINENVDVINLKIPFRLYAPSDRDENYVKGDFHWKQFLFGGEYVGQQLPKRLNSEKIFYNASFIIPSFIDYTKQAAYLSTPETEIPPSTSQCSIFSNYYDYNHYVQKYQDWSHDLESELLMPNFYVVSEYYHDALVKGLVDLSFGPMPSEVAHTQMGYMKNKMETVAYHFPVGHYYNELQKDEYFGSFFTETGDNSKYANTALRSQQNILFDQHYFEYVMTRMTAESDEFPYITKNVKQKLSTFFNVEIKFDRQLNSPFEASALGAGAISIDGDYDDLSGGLAEAELETPFDYKYTSLDFSGPRRSKQLIRESIQKNNFSSRMLEVLKDIDEGTITDIPAKKLPFNFFVAKDSFSLTDTGIVAGTPITERPDEIVGLKSINFLDFLTYTYNNYDVALNDNYIFAGGYLPFTGVEDAYRAATMTDDTFNRILNSQSLIEVIDTVKDTMNSYMEDLNPYSRAGGGFGYDIDHRIVTADIIKYLYGANFKNNEVLAYKVEKIAGPATGDSSNQNVIQKFWVFNTIGSRREISLYDSQVKYGKDYTYRITAYVLVLTHKYKYGDFRLTKQIGAADYLGEDGIVEYCLQFYDPENNVISPQLFSEASLSIDEDDPRRSILSGLNDIAPSSAEISRHPQLADFNLYVEPCMELIEVPMFEKTIKVMDSPCNSINVTPFHFLDDTNRVGFQINQESFIKRPYPELINSVDLKNRSDYYSSKELVPYKPVSLFSQSPARYIELYRIKQKPNSFADFNESLVATIDLRIKDEVYNFSNKIISDQIRSNTIYYYILRFVNENGVHGPLSQIIQCELVDDGGYTYALFDTIDSSEFNPSQVTTNTVPFKKIMQIDPNLQQLYFDDQAINYNDFAKNQVDNLVVGLTNQSIWDKKFKIRLTSKKTSKKLDLNITYNKILRNLSKYADSESPPTDYVPEDVPTHSELVETVPGEYESGATAVDPIAEPRGYGITKIPVDPEIDFDGVGFGSDSAIVDKLVTADDLATEFASYGIKTEGIGFPRSIYNFHSRATSGTGLGFLTTAVRGRWDPGAKMFNDDYYGGEFVRMLTNFLYDARNNHEEYAPVLVPMDKHLTIATGMLLIMYLPYVAHTIFPEYGKPEGHLYRPGGEHYDHLTAQLLTRFSSKSPFNNAENYQTLETHPAYPPDYNMAKIMENFGYPEDLFTSEYILIMYPGL